MVNVSIPRRYARALLAIAQEASNFDQVRSQLEQLADTFQTSPELQDIMLNPGYTRSERSKVVEALLKAASSTEPAVANLLRLLAERNRLHYLADIARLFRDLSDTSQGRIRGLLVMAVPLAEGPLRKLESNLGQLTQRRVILESRVDASILGGAAAQVGSVLYDSSLKTQLEQLRLLLRR